MEDENTEDTTEETEGTSEEETTEEEWTPPTREEWEAQQEALKKAQASGTTARTEAKQRREWLKAAGIDPHTGKKYESSGESEGGQAEEVSRVRAESDALRERLMRAAARASLQTAGIAEDTVALLLPHVDLSDLDVADDGSIDGLSAQIEELKSKYPTLFPAQKPARSAPVRTAETRRKDTSTKPPSYGDLLLGRG